MAEGISFEQVSEVFKCILELKIQAMQVKHNTKKNHVNIDLCKYLQLLVQVEHHKKIFYL